MKMLIIIIIIFLLVLSVVFFGVNIFAETEELICQRDLSSEIYRIKEIACISAEHQITKDFLDLEGLDCLEKIYYKKYGKICYKYVDETEIKCDEIKCGALTTVEFIGFDEKYGVIDISKREKYKILVERNIISLYPCTGATETCENNFINNLNSGMDRTQLENDCVSIGCTWIPEAFILFYEGVG